MRTLSFALLLCLLPAIAHGAAGDRRQALLWQSSVVSLEVTRQQYDHLHDHG